jgi:hypothetical protein
MDRIANPRWTAKNVATLVSMRSSSIMTNPRADRVMARIMPA